MTLTTQQRTALVDILTANRPDWLHSGIIDATKALAERKAHWATLQTQAINAARVASNRDPRTILTTIPGAQPASHQPIPPCPTHGGLTTRGPGGPYSCCWAEECG